MSLDGTYSSEDLNIFLDFISLVLCHLLLLNFYECTNAYYCILTYFWLLHMVQVILVALLFISGCTCPTCLDKLLACEKIFPQCVQTLLGIALLFCG